MNFSLLSTMGNHHHLSLPPFGEHIFFYLFLSIEELQTPSFPGNPFSPRLTGTGGRSPASVCFSAPEIGDFEDGSKGVGDESC